MNLSNKKVYYNYEILDTYTAGFMLTGPEVKAVCDNGASFGDAYCVIEDGCLILKKFHISVKDDLDTLRDRRLLLNKKELRKLDKVLKEKGLTIVPISVFTTKTGLIKASVALAKGKRNYDKRESIKKKDLERRNDD